MSEDFPYAFAILYLLLATAVWLLLAGKRHGRDSRRDARNANWPLRSAVVVMLALGIVLLLGQCAGPGMVPGIHQGGAGL